MAYLNGHPDHSPWSAASERARSTLHLAELFRLADKAGLLPRPRARRRAHGGGVLAVRGGRCGRYARPRCRAVAAVGQHRDSPQAGRSSGDRRGLRAARHCRDQPVARPGGGRRARTGRGRAIKDAGLKLSGYCHGGLFPATGEHVMGGARRQSAHRRRGRGARRPLRHPGGRRPAPVRTAGLDTLQGHRRRAKR